MPRALLVLVGIVCCSASVMAEKHSARLEPLDATVVDILRPRGAAGPRLTLADSCFVSPNSDVIYRIDQWVTGQELYKSYMDPAASCGDSAYPFTVAEINLPMAFDGATNLVISVDLEAIDSVSVPGCKIPGEVISISQDWELSVPAGGGLFNVWIPLDSPVTITGPVFAGFFIGNAIDPAVNPAVLADDSPEPCVSFNIWDEQVGWVDLTNNSFYSFPGNLAMEISGTPAGGTVDTGGGDTTQPAPQAAWLYPTAASTIYGSTELWAADTSGSNQTERTVFEYSFAGSGWTVIGTDIDGTVPLRNGVGGTATAQGFSLIWDGSGLTEGTYFLRATVYDSAGRNNSVTQSVYLEPTPPVASIVEPDPMDTVCGTIPVLLTVPDEDVDYIQLYRRDASSTYHSGMIPLNQFLVGDNNGNPGDGNFASNGEFGDYYNAPAAAASALWVWHLRGYTEYTAGGTLSLPDLAEALAVVMRTREDLGTRDDRLMLSLQDYLAGNGTRLSVTVARQPSYRELRRAVESQQQAVIVGLSGNRGIWVGIEGFNGWRRPDGAYQVYVASPLSGAVEQILMRPGVGGWEMFFASSWEAVDLMVAIGASDWSVPQQFAGADQSGADGWQIDWTAASLTDSTWYWLETVTRDQTNRRGSSGTLVYLDCTSAFIVGDLNGDSFVDIGDMLLLLDFLMAGGSPPSGGAVRGDVNCDGVLNIADAVYYVNFLFGRVSPPCR